jgi:hypothetical protein
MTAKLALWKATRADTCATPLKFGHGTLGGATGENGEG